MTRPGDAGAVEEFIKSCPLAMWLKQHKSVGFGNRTPHDPPHMGKRAHKRRDNAAARYSAR